MTKPTTHTFDLGRDDGMVKNCIASVNLWSSYIANEHRIGSVGPKNGSTNLRQAPEIRVQAKNGCMNDLFRMSDIWCQLTNSVDPKKIANMSKG